VNLRADADPLSGSVAFWERLRLMVLSWSVKPREVSEMVGRATDGTRGAAGERNGWPGNARAATERMIGSVRLASTKATLVILPEPLHAKLIDS